MRTDASVGFAKCGLGSIATIDAVAGPIRTGADARATDDRWRALLFHDLLHDGVSIAQRGYLALGVDIDDDHVDAFAAAVGRFLERHRDTR